MLQLLYKKISSILLLILSCMTLLAFADNTHLITEEKYVPVPGGQIWYQINYYNDTKNKTPILIVHGGPGVPHDYLNSLVTLAKQRPVIFYDQLGCGHSQIKDNDNALWTLERFEQELDELIKAFHLKNVYLFGHSWGGGLATQYALKHSNKIKGLILSSPLLSTSQWVSDAQVLLGKLDNDTQRIIKISEERGDTSSDEYQKAMDDYYHHYVCRLDPWPSTLVYAFEHMNLNVYHTMWGSSEFTMNGNLKNFDLTNKLRYLNMPVLLTAGHYDEARPETISNFAKNIKNVTMIVYFQSAHLAFLEESEDYLNDLRRFLRKSDES